MIRRNPTLIAMNDTDVQQVRDLIAKRRAETEDAKRATSPAAAATADEEESTASATPAAPAALVAAEDAKRKREAMTREERLGLR
ncbi:hypothetical protein A0H81_12775 [Grifola frondosa]|uniref:Uncharacterized protein n=1 Tax=Grifola frondosa TaxID=5627 RepID=A0A1C7LQX9_GRIFR|nr:hypothetical protein A0H81_12775 [Grifola frondosa]